MERKKRSAKALHFATDGMKDTACGLPLRGVDRQHTRHAALVRCDACAVALLKRRRAAIDDR